MFQDTIIQSALPDLILSKIPLPFSSSSKLICTKFIKDKNFLPKKNNVIRLLSTLLKSVAFIRYYQSFLLTLIPKNIVTPHFGSWTSDVVRFQTDGNLSVKFI
ncbi:hypothetical protein AQUCO_01300195v1 [Aquilegia coerulea]|uniref:Uncharacterized protein n=1 Tax=Aquilegia coerulea TaxID=218851 RepID=A0A2G5E055_AQUCA|nr:hypothetical protein AQUCO_01300195v1 [Aquilegia coerulea]